MKLQDKAQAIRVLVHPGSELLERMLEEDLSLSQLAQRIGVDRELLRDFLLGAADVTPDLAVQLAKGTGLSADYWIRMQESHDAIESGNPLPIDVVEQEQVVAQDVHE